MVDFKYLGKKDALDREVRACTACTARQEARSPVPGYGNVTGVVFIGKNPGRMEDIEGKPFQGPSGEILDIFLEWCGLSRNDIFLDNLIRCHTLDDRDPTRDEVRACVRLHLFKYLELMQPFLVVTMGAPASMYLCGVKKISQDHGKIFWNTRGFWTIPIYHPGSILHDGSKRDDLIFDAVHIKRFLKRKEHWVGQRDRRLQEEVNASSTDAGT